MRTSLLLFSLPFLLAAGCGNENPAGGGDGGTGDDAEVADAQSSDGGVLQMCQPGQAGSVPCGRNGRGSAPASCVGGVWEASGACVDPDVCTDGTSERLGCGPGQERSRSCTLGQWGAFTSCLPPFVGLALDDEHFYRDVCGLRADGSLACASMTPALPALARLELGGLHDACGLRSDGTLVCDCRADLWHMCPVPSGRFTSLAMGETFACAVTDTGTVRCWGDTAPGAFAGAGFQEVKARGRTACAVAAGGAVTCHGPRASEMSPPSGARLQRLAVSADGGCGVQLDGTLLCWGSEGGVPPPSGVYVDVVLGAGHACALRADGTVACFGGEAATGPPTGARFGALAGGFAICGITDIGELACWGSTERGGCGFAPWVRGVTGPRGVCGDPVACACGNSYDTSSGACLDGNDRPEQALRLPDVTDAGGGQTSGALSNNDSDHYRVHVRDTATASLDPALTVTTPVGQELVVCMEYLADDGGTGARCDTGGLAQSGSTIIIGGQTANGCCRTVRSGSSGTLTMPPLVGLGDDSGTYFIEIYRTSSTAPVCASYALSYTF